MQTKLDVSSPLGRFAEMVDRAGMYRIGDAFEGIPARYTFENDYGKWSYDVVLGGDGEERRIRVRAAG